MADAGDCRAGEPQPGPTSDQLCRLVSPSATRDGSTGVHQRPERSHRRLYHYALEGAGEGRREIKVRMSASENATPPKRDNEYILSELSEGQRVLIGLYAVMHFALKPGTTVCFDEPDNFIALGEVQPWLSRVLDQTEDDSGSQVLIVSHHPELLNRMAFKEGILIDRPAGRHARARPFDDPSQTGLSAAELVLRGWERE